MVRRLLAARQAWHAALTQLDDRSRRLSVGSVDMLKRQLRDIESSEATLARAAKQMVRSRVALDRSRHSIYESRLGATGSGDEAVTEL